jgi:effector-binding domain-containing protein
VIKNEFGFLFSANLLSSYVANGSSARMLRRMTVEVTVRTVEPMPTAVVAAGTTWAEFPKMWGPMLDQVWSFLRGGAPEGLYKHGHNVMLYKDDVPNVEVGVQVSGPFNPVGHVVASTLPGGLAATANHTGPVTKIGDTHRAVREWSEANGYRLAGPHWEIYGDPKPSSGDFDVQVFWALAPGIQR